MPDTEDTEEKIGEYGGYCDCEVIFNVGDSWGDRVGYKDDEDDN
jgi:hypothetical protein